MGAIKRGPRFMGAMLPRFVTPEGWVFQAFCFALDLTDEQRASVNRHFGARRYACNWAVATMKADIATYHASGAETPAPSLPGLRKRWNVEKDSICVNAATGEPWWREVSKETFSDGIKGAVDGYWQWQKSRAGNLSGKRVGFPRFKKKGRDSDRCTFTTGAMRVEPDHRHLTLPRIGLVRTHENTRKIERLIRSGRARILSITLRRRGSRIIASVKVVVRRPQQPGVTRPDSVVGVDVGVRMLATVATPDAVIVRVENPKALNSALGQLRRLNRQRARRTPGSRQYRDTTIRISRLHARVANIRQTAIHRLTANLAKTHGLIVVEGLDAAGMLRQKGLTGARARRRGLSDAALGEHRRQLRYKCAWYGSVLVEVDRFYPSSKTCSACGNINVIGWSEHFECRQCHARHQRDENAAVNLARQGDLGGVAAPVKHGAKRKTGPPPAVGPDMREGDLASVGSLNPERGTV
jgi:putative transposase